MVRRFHRRLTEIKQSIITSGVRGLLYSILRTEMWVCNQLYLMPTLFDFERRSIRRFVRESAARLPNGSTVLDAGAGEVPFKGFFGACQYESCDVHLVSTLGYKHDFHCNLSEQIPKDGGTYDAVLCTQVLEHVPNPEASLREFARILKPGGHLFITVPQGDPLHEIPHHYFNFTPYGLSLLLERSGFTIDSIRARTGYPRTVSYRCMNMWPMIGRQSEKNWLLCALLILSYPVLQFLFGLLPGVFGLCADWIDRERGYTLGYACCAVRKEGLKA
jgi:SAM-dependent methyltransferase